MYGPLSFNFVPVRIISQREIVSSAQQMPNSFSVAFEGQFAHAISRPFRANRFIGCFPGLKPWAKFFSPPGAIKQKTA
jgi:hypothetical protein